MEVIFSKENILIKGSDSNTPLLETFRLLIEKDLLDLFST